MRKQLREFRTFRLNHFNLLTVSSVRSFAERTALLFRTILQKEKQESKRTGAYGLSFVGWEPHRLFTVAFSHFLIYTAPAVTWLLLNLIMEHHN